MANRFPLQPDQLPDGQVEKLEERKRKGEFPLLSALKLDECDYHSRSSARTHKNISLPALMKDKRSFIKRSKRKNKNKKRKRRQKRLFGLFTYPSKKLTSCPSFPASDITSPGNTWKHLPSNMGFYPKFIYTLKCQANTSSQYHQEHNLSQELMETKQKLHPFALSEQEFSTYPLVQHNRALCLALEQSFKKVLL